MYVPKNNWLLDSYFKYAVLVTLTDTVVLSEIWKGMRGYCSKILMTIFPKHDVNDAL